MPEQERQEMQKVIEEYESFEKDNLEADTIFDSLEIFTKFRGIELDQIKRLKELKESDSTEFESQRPTKMKVGNVTADG